LEPAWLMAVPANGVSALTLSRVLLVGSYQTAWTMLAKYRAAIHAASKAKLSGTVEVDEWAHGGVRPGGNGQTGKDLVVAAVERAPHGEGFCRVRFAVVPDRSAWQLRKAIRANIEPGSRIITDGLSAYVRATAGYVHEPRNESAPDAPPAHELLPGVHRVFSLCDRWRVYVNNGGWGLHFWLSCAGLSRSGKLIAKALRAGFRRLIQRFWPLPVGSKDRVTRYRHFNAAVSPKEVAPGPHGAPVAGARRLDGVGGGR
jgi:hypothetical protein